jgi:hypothetical protein
MASVNPLYNIKLQGTLNLNNQALLNNTEAKAYSPKNIGAVNKTLDASDMGRALIFSGSRTLTIGPNISGVTSGDNFLAGTSSSSQLTFSNTGGVIFRTSELIWQSPNFLKLIYLDGNVWLICQNN